MNGLYNVALMQLSGALDPPFPWKEVITWLVLIAGAVAVYFINRGEVEMNENVLHARGLKTIAVLAIVVTALLALSGCAGGKLKAVSEVDLDLAISQAQAADDTQAVLCFTEIKAFIGTGIPQVQVKGVFSALETARIGRRAVDSGIPESLHIACSPLIVDANTTLIKLGLLTRF